MLLNCLPSLLLLWWQVQKWINELCEELSERLLRDLEQNKRIAHTLTFHASASKVFCCLSFRFNIAIKKSCLFFSMLLYESQVYVRFIFQMNDLESHKKFPSKSCPLRYGTAKIQEDALNLFHAGLREYIGISHLRMKQCNEWAITGLSVSASKIIAIPSVSRSDFMFCCSFFLLFGYYSISFLFADNLTDCCSLVSWRGSLILALFLM